MKVVILCGGLGTRLRDETEYRPKPMVPVGGRPILWHIMKTYAHYGHKDFVLCLGSKGELIKEFFRNYRWNTSDITLSLGGVQPIIYHAPNTEQDWTVTLVETGMETATGGRLQRALPFISDETFLCTYGDRLSNSDINQSIEFHRKHGGMATVTTVNPASWFGELAAAGQAMTAFDEKRFDETHFVSGGLFVFQKAIAQYLDGDATVLEKEPFERLARDRQLKPFSHAGFWHCLDTYRDHELLNRMWDNQRAPWKVW